MPTPDAVTFAGLRVLSLESRRAREMATLITTFGGRPIVAPALREVPLGENPAAIEFARRLNAGTLDMVVFLTGVGARALVEAVEPELPRPLLVAALSRVKVVVRGPKPLAVMRELNIPVWASASEPNTWREVIDVIQRQSGGERFDDVRIAVQEYGASNPELLEALRARGAEVTAVPVYKWALPEDIQPLRDAVATLARGEVDVVFFTTSMQLVHLMQIAAELKLEAGAREGLERALVASIGPTTSAELRRQGFTVDIEAAHPKIGFLVREAAERSASRRR